MAGWLPLAKGPSITTIFTASLNADDLGNGGYSLRNKCLLTGGPGALSQIRITVLAAAASQALAVNNVGIGVWDGIVGTAQNTTLTPTEVTFTTNGAGSPAHGFSIGIGASIVSDWIPLTFSNGNSLIVIFDSGGTAGYRSLSVGSNQTSYKLGATYNQASPAAQTANVVLDGISLIETQ